MNIHIVVAAWLPARAYGGPITLLERLLPDLQAAGAKITIVTSNLAAMGQASLPAGFDQTQSPPVWRLASKLHFRWSVWSDWPDDLPKADIVHVLGAWNGLAYQAIYRALARGLRVIWEPTGMLPIAGRWRLLKRLLTPWHRNLANRVDQIIWTSQVERGEAPFVVPPERSVLRPNPAPHEPLRTSKQAARAYFGLPLEKKIWGYLGRINQRKGIERMLDAWLESESQQRLVFAGPVELSKLAERIDDTWPHVRRFAALDEQQRWLFLQAIDCLVLVPEFGENFGNVVVEAALLKTPVVVSPAVGAAEYFAGDPGIRIVDGFAELANVFGGSEIPPAPRGVPAELLAKNVAQQQLQIYQKVLAQST